MKKVNTLIRQLHQVYKFYFNYLTSFKVTKKSYFLSWLQALSKERNNQIYSNFGRRITASKKNNEEIRLKQIIVYNNNHCPDAFLKIFESLRLCCIVHNL